jgi:hypothetical protein
MNTFRCFYLHIYIVIITVASFNYCPIENILNSKCYHFVSIAIDSHAAERYCNNVGPNGHLASIGNEFINTALASNFTR